MKVFDTDRYIIRRLRKSDIDAFHDMQSNPKVMRYIKPYMNRNESGRELARFISYYEDEHIHYDIWAIEQKSSNQFIGICGVYQNDQSKYEIAYRLRESYWGRGIASEVFKGLIKYCFNYTKIEQLCAYVSVGNKGSIHILEKEMNFVNLCYSEKGKSLERYYVLERQDWITRQSVVIEKVQNSDAQELTELTIRSRAHWNYGAEQINKWLSDLTVTEDYITKNILYKLIDDKCILGYYSLIHQSETNIKMDNLFVEPESIGHGYGSILLKDACQRARNRGYLAMTLDADPNAEQFYLSKGFKVFGKLPTSIDGRFLPIMKKEL